MTVTKNYTTTFISDLLLLKKAACKPQSLLFFSNFAIVTNYKQDICNEEIEFSQKYLLMPASTDVVTNLLLHDSLD